MAFVKAEGGVVAIFVRVRSCCRQEESDLFSMSALAGQKVMGVFCQGTFQQETLCLWGARGQVAPKWHGVSIEVSEGRFHRHLL